jgi:predicted ArsR family transcriptional regulator
LKSQTRQLVQLLAEDVTGRMITALRTGPQTAPQLEKLAGSSQKTVAGVLELLQAHGIVDWAPQESTAAGRPSRLWRLAADDELKNFEGACDDFKARLLRRELDQFDNG